MRLFTLDENYQVELNKEWIMLIPEFNALLKRDKGSPGDYRGEKKLKARKEFTYIYFYWDFTSPIRDWEDYERHMEAMKYAGLEEKDMDGPLMEASKHYNELLLKGARSLKTLRAVEKSLTALDTHFETLDFTKVDKKGELVYKTNTYLLDLQRLDAAYTSVEKFKKRVTDELKGTDSKIRGTASLGRKETTGMGEWREGSQLPDPSSATESKTAPAFKSLADMIEQFEKEEDDE